MSTLERYIVEDDVYRLCVDCNRRFSLVDEIDREEYFYGHDCQPVYTVGGCSPEDADLCEICEWNEKEYAEGKWCNSCKRENKESDIR
jgi:hypothetical protein